jgi:hypothetical protein
MVIQRHDAWEGGSSGKVAATSLRDSDEHGGAPVMTVDMRSRGMRICVLLAWGERGDDGAGTPFKASECGGMAGGGGPTRRHPASSVPEPAGGVTAPCGWRETKEEATVMYGPGHNADGLKQFKQFKKLK